MEVRVHPTLVPKSHLLASVNGVFNAVCVRGDVVGDTIYHGRGAGMDPTSSAVISDLVERGADAIVLGCTEIGLLIGPNDADVPVFDSTRVHARRAVDLALHTA